ncbi:MAG: hypothetical protein HFE63_07700 [Clostridiales bacterium]|nr:hypothetical protein [Clostridiales bacterium]
MDKMKRALKLGYVGNTKALIIATCIGFLVGEIALFIIMAATKADDYMSLGTFLGRIVLNFMTLFITVSAFTQDFKDLVKLGVTRKTAVISITLQTLGAAAILECVMLLLDLVTKLLMRLVFGVSDEFLLTGVSVPWLGFMIIAGVFFAGLIGAVCVNKFGPYGMVAIYFVYMIIFMVVPGLIERLQENEIFNRIITFVLSSSLTIFGSAAVVIIIISIFLLRSVYKSQIQ